MGKNTTAFKDWCFHWEPAAYVTEPNSLYTKAAPPQTTEFTLFITANNFRNQWQETQMVYVEPQITSISAVPDQCFTVGETFTVEQFNVTVQPGNGKIDDIIFEPAVAPLQPYGTQYPVEVVIRLGEQCEGGSEVETTVTVTVVNPDYQFEYSGSLPWSGIDGAIDEIKKIEKTILEAVPGKIQICDVQLGPPSLECEYTQGKICCPDEIPYIRDANTTTGYLVFSAGYECSVPFYGIAYVLTANVDFGASLEAKLGCSFIETCTIDDICLTLSGKIKFSGGLSASLGHGIFGSAGAGLAGEVTIPVIDVCLPPNFRLKPRDKRIIFKAFLYAKVEGAGLSPAQIQFPLFEKVWMLPF